MKIVCNREGLLMASQLLNVVVPPRDVNPVLRNVKIVADGDRFTMIATDTEVGIRMEVRSVKVDESGEALVPAARLLSILREATDDELVIEANMDACMLRGKHAEFEMPGEDPSHFPDFPEFAEDKYHEFQAGELREMIRRTQFAVASAEHARYGAMTGILWELEDKKARLVATDGRRLALTEGPATGHGGHGTNGQMPVAPIKAMTLLERNLNEPDELVRIAVRPNEILIKTERSMIYSRLVEGRYPNYRQVFPDKTHVKVPITVGPFLTAIRQAAIMTDEESKRVVFSFAADRLTLQARGTGAGSSKVEMDLDYKGDPVDISFDPKFLLDMLRVLEPDARLTLEMSDGNSRVLFRNEDDNYQYVVVPLVVRDGQS
jgi:DNA polymerase-3 subunit beta